MSDAFPPADRHGTIEQPFDDLFVVRGTARFAPLVSITRNMTIVRHGGELTLVSAVRLDAAGERELERLGDVKHLVKIGNFHGMDDPYYVKRYAPTVWAAPGAVHKPGVRTDRELAPGGELPFPNATYFSFERATKPEGCILVAKDGGILLAADSVQNWGDFGGCSFLGKLMMRSGGFGGAARIGPGWRSYAEPKDGVGFKPDFERLLTLELRHVLSAHGYPLRDTAKTDLAKRFEEAYAAKRTSS